MHRNPPKLGTPRGARPVYMAALGRNVQKATIRAIHDHRLWRRQQGEAEGDSPYVANIGERLVSNGTLAGGGGPTGNVQQAMR